MKVWELIGGFNLCASGPLGILAFALHYYLLVKEKEEKIKKEIQYYALTAEGKHNHMSLDHVNDIKIVNSEYTMI